MRRVRVASARWFSRRVAAVKRERLERAMRAPRRRRALLGLVFTAMPRAVRSRALEREDAVIEWRVTGRADGHREVRQLVITGGSAQLVEGESCEPDLRLTIDGVDLLLLATGNASGASLFLRGRVEVDGDPWLAIRLPRLFAV